MIRPLSDIIAEKLGQRGWGAGGLHEGWARWQALATWVASQFAYTILMQASVDRKHSAILRHLPHSLAHPLHKLIPLLQGRVHSAKRVVVGIAYYNSM